MAHIAPMPLDQVSDPELRDLIEKCEATGAFDPVFLGIVARVPAQAKPMLNVLLMAFTQGNVDHKLKEVIRILLARFSEDSYFAALRSKKAREAGLTEEDIEAGVEDYEDAAQYGEAEKWALRFADQMFLDATKVDAAFYDNLKQHYTEAQIMELGAFIALFHAVHMWTRTLDAQPAAAH